MPAIKYNVSRRVMAQSLETRIVSLGILSVQGIPESALRGAVDHLDSFAWLDDGLGQGRGCRRILACSYRMSLHVATSGFRSCRLAECCDLLAQSDGVERLDQVIGRTGTDCLNDPRPAGFRRDHDDRHAEFPARMALRTLKPSGAGMSQSRSSKSTSACSSAPMPRRHRQPGGFLRCPAGTRQRASASEDRRQQPEFACLSVAFGFQYY